MLVLSRKIGETIVVDGAIMVTVLAIKGRGVRLGIAAPLQVPIVRSELLPAAGESEPRCVQLRDHGDDTVDAVSQVEVVGAS